MTRIHETHIRGLASKIAVSFENYSQAIRAGSDWLKSKLQDDGSYGERANYLAYYSKSPWAFAASGEPWLSSLVGDHVKKAFLKEDGDFIVTNSEFPLYDQWAQQHYLYYECWLTYGLQKIGRFDVTYKTMNFIRGFQDSTLGGFYSNKKREHMDTLITSICGLCCISSGSLDEAVKAGDFLALVLSKQSDQSRFYTGLSKDGKLAKEFPEDRKLYYLVEKTKLDQWYFYLGLPIAFLAKLFEASGNQKFIELARRYFEVAEQCEGDVFKWNGTGKLSWGSSLLFKHLKDWKYYGAATSIVSDLFRSQTKEGGFLSLRADYKSLDDQPLLASIDVTSETIALGSETIQALR